jgi:hypothetical protein
MNDLFNIKFSEEQQAFHHNYEHAPPKNDGWTTLIRNADDKMGWIFSAYIEQNRRQKFTLAKLQKKVKKLERFKRELEKFNLAIR